MPLNWQAAVDDLSDVGKLVHLVMRQDPYSISRVKNELLRDRRRYYEAELTDQARRVGCPGQVGRLTNSNILSELNLESARDATSIVNTYNADLASAIRYIRAETPTANRYVYAKRLGAWEQKRSSWKNNQIAQYTEGSARAKAQQDFHRNNGTFGVAVLLPKRAICPICIGWVNRGEVPLNIATNNPGPFHPNCFPPGTEVSRPGGERVPIEDIRKGESVMDCSGETAVCQVFRRDVAEVLYTLYVGGQVLRVTGDHPVLKDCGWRPVRKLRVGDMVVVVDHESQTGDKSRKG